MSDVNTQFQWEDIFNAIGHPAIILDREHNVIAANNASSKITGINRELIIGRRCYEVFHDKNSAAPPEGCPMEKMLQSGQMETTDMEMEAMGGVYMVSCTPILNTDGALDKVIHIATDITERKRGEALLLEQKLFIESLVTNSTIATFVIDQDHKVIIWNKACENLTQFSAENIIGTTDHWKAFYAEEHPTLADVVLDHDFERLPDLYSNVGKLFHDSDGYKAEGWFINVGGKDRYFLVEAAPIKNSQGKIISIIETLHDLTESKTLEAQLLHAQKMESIGHLAGGVAHEFNNILAVIIGYGQMLRNSFDAGSRVMNDLDQIILLLTVVKTENDIS